MWALAIWIGSVHHEGEGSCCIRGWVLSSSSEAVVVDLWSLVSPYKSSTRVVRIVVNGLRSYFAPCCLCSAVDSCGP